MISMLSRVARATPPSVPDAGEGRMNAAGSAARRGIRVLSPRIEPPVRLEEGSTASTATRWPRPVSMVPNASMNVDLPTPGTPVMPTRIALPVCGSSSLSTCCAISPVVRPGRLHQGDGAGDVGPRAVQYAPYVPRRAIGRSGLGHRAGQSS